MTLKVKGLWLHLLPTRTRGCLLTSAAVDPDTQHTINCQTLITQDSVNSQPNHGLCIGYLFCPHVRKIV